MSELKPCPFCGGKAELVSDNNGRYKHCVRCIRCGAKNKGTAFENDEFNIKAWNTRAEAWIPVSERLPEDDKLVMIWDKDWYNLGRYDKYDRGGCWKDLTSYLRSVTHWQPLPEPPK